VYQLVIRKGAQKTIARQSRPVGEQMIKEIDLLRIDPDDPALDIERVTGGPELRLKFKGAARQFRAIFLRDDGSRTIDVRVIAPRGQVYDQRRLRR